MPIETEFSNVDIMQGTGFKELFSLYILLAEVERRRLFFVQHPELCDIFEEGTSSH
jgi:hypothetical protein